MGKRYIDADALYETLCALWDRSDGEEFETGVFKVIQEAPTADVRENRMGKWIEFEENIEGLRYKIKRCSVCGATKPMKIFENEDFAFNFCTNCGSDNRGDADA